MKDFHWQDSTIYHIYPKSFQDSNGDGIGDIPGIIQRLDYLKSKKATSLNVDAIWLSPFYPSPMKDGGYDVSDFCAIDPQFGTLQDFDRLLTEAHARDLKVVIDYIPNHTSDQHAWFKESRSSKTNPKRDWYIWRDAKPDGSVPNNWLSVFGGSAWEFDEATGQYFHHTFAVEQPDLNWDNPEVKQAMFDAVRFWLDRGVDGLRVDSFAHVMKDYTFPDEPENPGYDPEHEEPYRKLLHVYAKDVVGKHTLLKELCDVVDEYEHKLLVIEAYLELEDVLRYYSVGEKETLSPFNFLTVTRPWSAPIFRDFLHAYERGRRPHDIGNFVLSNHDNPRVATRISREAARTAAVLLFSLRGIPFVYYGDEIGMKDGDIPPELVQDPRELNNPGKGLGRDPSRTPMQWDTGQHAGFTRGTPWLPIPQDSVVYNVAKEQTQPDSFLALYKRLIAIRQDSPALRRGAYVSVDTAENDVLVFLREEAGERIIVIINFSPEPKHISLPYGQGIILCHSARRDEGRVFPLKDIPLMGNDAYIIKLTS